MCEHVKYQEWWLKNLKYDRFCQNVVDVFERESNESTRSFMTDN